MSHYIGTSQGVGSMGYNGGSKQTVSSLSWCVRNRKTGKCRFSSILFHFINWFTYFVRVSCTQARRRQRSRCRSVHAASTSPVWTVCWPETPTVAGTSSLTAASLYTAFTQMHAGTKYTLLICCNRVWYRIKHDALCCYRKAEIRKIWWCETAWSLFHSSRSISSSVFFY